MNEINNLKFSEVEFIYKKWYDHMMNTEITKLALAGVEYADPAKANTSYYSDYISMSKQDTKLSYHDELKRKAGIKEVVKRPKFLFEKKEGA